MFGITQLFDDVEIRISYDSVTKAFSGLTMNQRVRCLFLGASGACEMLILCTLFIWTASHFTHLLKFPPSWTTLLAAYEQQQQQGLSGWIYFRSFVSALASDLIASC